LNIVFLEIETVQYRQRRNTLYIYLLDYVKYNQKYSADHYEYLHTWIISLHQKCI